jgi:Asp-tRNA(Asn)/Glu-tRNA(Gln) amidotransferase A subunit family amidase
MPSFALENSSIRELIAACERGDLDATEIARECIEKFKRFEPWLHAWACFDPERTLEQARAAEHRFATGQVRGSLEGIPIGVKDVFNTTDFPTEMGSQIWKGYTPGNDARAVFYLRQAGAIIPGKTSTAEFAVHALGNTINPHDETRTPGTSSSGSAASVAAGMVKAAIGTQTGASVVRPASYCGIYGFKPSFGLIPRTGMLKTTDSLDTVGFFVRHLEDLETLFDVLRVHGGNYPISNAALTDEHRQSSPVGRPWRVALVRTHVWKFAQPYAQEQLIKWGQKLDALPEIEVHDIELPRLLEASHDVHAKIYDKTLAYYFSEEFKKPEQMSPVMQDIVSRGSTVTKADYLGALEQQSQMIAAMENFFQQYDIVVSLSTAGPAPLRGETEPSDPALIWTMCQLPAISVPKFLSPDRLPFGAQVVARRYNDLQLLRFMDLLHEADQVPSMAFPELRLAGPRHAERRS